jgi:aquaporin Z
MSSAQVLAGEEPAGRGAKFPWPLFLSELAGTALLVLGGLSCVILMNGEGSPLPQILPDAGVRRAITGFLFGTTGALIAISAVGRISGAHVNPAVSVGFWLVGKMKTGTLLIYVMGQLAGAVLGALPLFGFGQMGRSVAFGATVPGPNYGVMTALGGEITTTFAMVALLCIFLASRRLRGFTPAIFPFLFSLMVFLEAPVSGTSTNPARTIGPALISGQWEGWWIYWVGPLLGTFVATLIFSALAKRIEVAKLYHFDTAHDRLVRRSH